MSNFERPYLHNGSSDPLHVAFYTVLGVGGSNGAISGSIKFRMAAGRHLGKLQRHRAVSLRQHGLLVGLSGTFRVIARRLVSCFDCFKPHQKSFLFEVYP